MTHEQIEAERATLEAAYKAQTITRFGYNFGHRMLDTVAQMRYDLANEQALTTSQEEVISELRQEVDSLRAAMERWRAMADEICSH